MSIAKCNIKTCVREVEAICKCTQKGVYLCHFHLMIHMEEIFQNPHKVEFLYMRVNDEDLEFILQTIELAKQKIDKELTKIMTASRAIISALNQKVEKELKKVMMMQQGLIQALEKTASMTRINKNSEVPIYKAILKNFEKVKASLKHPD